VLKRLLYAQKRHIYVKETYLCNQNVKEMCICKRDLYVQKEPLYAQKGRVYVKKTCTCNQDAKETCMCK